LTIHILGIVGRSVLSFSLSFPLSPSVDLKRVLLLTAYMGEAFALVTSNLTEDRGVMGRARGFQVDRWVQKKFDPQL
jgi:hypothetical protein